MVVATMHGKEHILRPVFQSHLGWETAVASGINTDVLGTFTGEIPRPGGPLEALRAKCRQALEHTPYRKVVASEGSFGPHPSAFFLPSDDEWLLYWDAEEDYEVVVRYLTSETNWSQCQVKTLAEARDWLGGVHFPSHAVVVRSPEPKNKILIKGILDATQFEESVERCLGKWSRVQLETDMRAHLNPTRQRAIQSAALRLVERLQSTCSECQSPGFGAVRATSGLPCSACGFPTESTLFWELSCVRCSHSTIRYNPHGKVKENPQFCGMCNP